jgi:transposase
MRALGILGQRHATLTAEITALETQISQLVAKHAAPLLALFGVGPDSASTLLAAAGDNPQRLHSDAAFAALCGTSPVEASSGKTIRHRLNRGGDRQANAALYRIVIVRPRWHQPNQGLHGPPARPGQDHQGSDPLPQNATSPERCSQCSTR